MMCLRPSVLTDQNRGSAFQTTPDAKPDCVSSGMNERLPLAGPSSDRRILPQSPDLDRACGRRNTFPFNRGLPLLSDKCGYEGWGCRNASTSTASLPGAFAF